MRTVGLAAAVADLIDPRGGQPADFGESAGVSAGRVSLEFFTDEFPEFFLDFSFSGEQGCSFLAEFPDLFEVTHDGFSE